MSASFKRHHTPASFQISEHLRAPVSQFPSCVRLMYSSVQWQIKTSLRGCHRNSLCLHTFSCVPTAGSG